MTLTYSVFISYPHLPAGPVTKFVDRLEQELTSRVATHCTAKYKIYRDKSRMVTGDELDPTVCQAMKESLAWIKILVPAYYFNDSRWCIRESVYADLISEERKKYESCSEIIEIVLAGKIELYQQFTPRSCLDARDFYNNPDRPDSECFNRIASKLEKIISEKLGPKTRHVYKNNGFPEPAMNIAFPSINDNKVVKLYKDFDAHYINIHGKMP